MRRKTYDESGFMKVNIIWIHSLFKKVNPKYKKEIIKSKKKLIRKCFFGYNCNVKITNVNSSKIGRAHV